MLSDNIRNLRKANNMSQDDLAEKLGVSRQSVSLWENGQTQPTVDNIIALSKIFNVTANDLLDGEGEFQPDVGEFQPDVFETAESAEPAADAALPQTPAITAATAKKKNKALPVIIALCAAVLIAVVLLVIFNGRDKIGDFPAVTGSETAGETAEPNEVEFEDNEQNPPLPVNDGEQGNDANSVDAEEVTAEAPAAAGNPAPADTPAAAETAPAVIQTTAPAEVFDLFTYCKNFAIQKGEVNGDYTMYQQPSSLYGGYENEYFSISYWGDSDMVEFCLHCPLDETYSINFYLRMRGGYNGKYEYLSSRYTRSDGISVREAKGYIDPAVFSDNYPLPCDEYVGTADKQNDFMEESRVGMCDLIKCLKQFAAVEGMDCGFGAFGFVNF